MLNREGVISGRECAEGFQPSSTQLNNSAVFENNQMTVEAARQMGIQIQGDANEAYVSQRPTSHAFIPRLQGMSSGKAAINFPLSNHLHPREDIK